MSGSEFLLLLILLCNFALLGSSRLRACIRVAGAQGLLLGGMALTLPSGGAPHLLLIALAVMALKGLLFPWMLERAMREANIRREVEPFVGYIPSQLFGGAAFGFALWMSARLGLSRMTEVPLLPPAALATVLIGMFLIMSRKKAISQALGYLVMENGIYIFGLALAVESPLLVEMGILLDVLAAVFVMGIAIFHINREFDHIDTHRMARLHDRPTLREPMKAPSAPVERDDPE